MGRRGTVGLQEGDVMLVEVELKAACVRPLVKFVEGVRLETIGDLAALIAGLEGMASTYLTLYVHQATPQMLQRLIDENKGGMNRERKA